jgi:hypothetical protein
MQKSEKRPPSLPKREPPSLLKRDPPSLLKIDPPSLLNRDPPSLLKKDRKVPSTETLFFIRILEMSCSILVLLHNGGFCNGCMTKRALYHKLFLNKKPILLRK